MKLVTKRKQNSSNREKRDRSHVDSDPNGISTSLEFCWDQRMLQVHISNLFESFKSRDIVTIMNSELIKRGHITRPKVS